VRETSLRVPAPSLIWVHGQQSGDMMIDGVPGVQAVKGVRPLILSGASTQHRGGGRTLREPAARISGVMGRARAQRS
jgi:hypothetical protein